MVVMNRSRQIALMGMSLEKMTEDQREWLIGFSSNYGVPMWAKIVVQIRLRKKRRKLEAQLVEALSDTIEMLQEHIRDGKEKVTD